MWVKVILPGHEADGTWLAIQRGNYIVVFPGFRDYLLSSSTDYFKMPPNRYARVHIVSPPGWKIHFPMLIDSDVNPADLVREWNDEARSLARDWPWP